MVTADDVEIAVEKCEKLWADALAAREKMDEISTEAESLAEESAASGEEAAAAVDGSDKFKLSMLGDMKAATDKNLDANSVLGDAVAAMEEADRLEALAEVAMEEMEAAIAQHLIDFPDSELGEDMDDE